jgi:hypothetical protein
LLDENYDVLFLSVGFLIFLKELWKLYMKIFLNFGTWCKWGNANYKMVTKILPSLKNVELIISNWNFKLHKPQFILDPIKPENLKSG